MLLMGAAVNCTRQGLMVSDRFNLTLGYLLNLFCAFTYHGLPWRHVIVMVDCVMRVG